MITAAIKLACPLLRIAVPWWIWLIEVNPGLELASAIVLFGIAGGVVLVGWLRRSAFSAWRSINFPRAA